MPGNKKRKNKKSNKNINKHSNNIEDESIINIKEKEIGDMSKTHAPISASEKEEPNVALDQKIDEIFESVKQFKNKSDIMQSRVRTIVESACLQVKNTLNIIGVKIGNVYYKASIQSAKIATKISNTKFYKKSQRNWARSMKKVWRKEEILSNKAASFIEILDNKLEYLENYVEVKCHELVWQLERALHYAENNKKKVSLYVGTSAAFILSVTLIIGSLTAYEYMYNGKTLGIVKDQEDVYRTIDAIGDKLSHEHNAEVAIDKKEDISFQKVLLLGKELDDKEDILSRLTYMKDMKVKGYAISIDGKQVAILQSKEAANSVLNNIENRYISTDDARQYEKIGFAEKVSIKSIETKLGKLQNKTEAMNYLLTGQKEKKIHVVQEGETLYKIAKDNGIKQKDLESSNPDINPEKISIGQEITLTQNAPMLTVETQEVATYAESIPYEIVYQDVNTKYKGENTVKLQGQNGERQVTARIVKKNGVEVDKTELSAKVINQPISQVVLRGTKNPPPLVGTGSFIYPVRGKITSGYGSRWGSFHPALDIAAPYGTPIKASDGGKVVFAGYNGSYGYMVKIDHGGNKVTLYGHCSRLFVKAGDRVYQGQHIANVGSTGNSTGPHVHFEVQVNGSTKNPLGYL